MYPYTERRHFCYLSRIVNITMKTALFTIGPAGTGKTTFSSVFLDYVRANKINAYYMNLDPATLDDEGRKIVTETVYDIRTDYDFLKCMSLYQLGPNGTLMKILHDFSVSKRLEEMCNNDYDFLIIDCPGQIEAYTHDGYFNSIISSVKECGYNVITLFTLDSTFLTNKAKLTSGLLIALYTMSQLDTPFVTIFTKMDLVRDDDELEEESLYDIFHNQLERVLDMKESQERQECQEQTVLEKSRDILDKFGTSCIIPVDITDDQSISSLYIELKKIYGNDEDDEDFDTGREADEEELDEPEPSFSF